MEQLPLELQADALVAGAGSAGRQLDRVVQIGRHYSWSQIARRGVSVLRQRGAGDRVIGEISCPEHLKLLGSTKFSDLAELVIGSSGGHRSRSQGDLPSGRLVLLNESHDLGWPIQWKRHREDLSHLWRFQLQYHEYLLSFLADHSAHSDPQHAAWQTIWQFLGTWSHQHHPQQVKVSADAWHPYCISRRVAVWIWLLSLGKPLPELQTTVVRSLYQQLDYLHRHLELDLRGNHLFENLTALVIGASFLDCPHSKRWLATARRYLKRELPAQVLAHGEHFELSPMYHCQILGNVMKMACLTGDTCPEVQRLCLDHAEPMWSFLQQILHPDGEIPLLGDSSFDEAPDVGQLAALATMCGVQDIPEPQPMAGHYWISRGATENRAESDFLIFDFGPVGAEGLPAHAHCDLLTLEASAGGRRWIVDSGNFDYRDGSMRHYCRSSMAHNVMTVAGKNQCDVWSKFRMGRRGRVVQSRTGRTGDFGWAAAAHDGYRQFGISRLWRLVTTAEQAGCWMCADFAREPCELDLIGYLHLAPEVKIRSAAAESADPETNIGDRVTHESPEFVLSDGISQRLLTFFGTSALEIVDGWYCPAFGFREKNKVLVYRQSGKLARPSGWLMQGIPATCKAFVGQREQDASSVRCQTPDQTFEWTFD